MTTTRLMGLRQAIIDYMQARPGVNVTGNQISKDLTGFDRNALLQSLAALARDRQFPVRRVGSGVYVWDDVSMLAIPVPDQMLTVRVLQHTPNGMVACDAEGMLYTIKKIVLP